MLIHRKVEWGRYSIQFGKSVSLAGGFTLKTYHDVYVSDGLMPFVETVESVIIKASFSEVACHCDRARGGWGELLEFLSNQLLQKLLA